MQDNERVGENPNFYFMSAVCSLAVCALVGVWWGRAIFLCGIALAVFFSARGLWQRRKLPQRRPPATSDNSDAG